MIIDSYRAGIGGVVPDDQAPPADPYWENVVLQCDFDGRDGFQGAFDQSPNNRTLTFSSSSVQLDNAEVVFGPTSVTLSSTNSTYIQVAASSDFDPSGDFTWEGWFTLPSSLTTTTPYDLFSKWWSTNGNRGYLCRYNHSEGQLQFLYSTTGDNTVTVAGSWSPSSRTPYFIRVVIESGVVTGYVNGTQIFTASLSGSIFSSPEPFRIGNHRDPGGGLTNGLRGWVDDLRLTKGVARTGPVPVSTYPVQGAVWGSYSWWIHPLGRRDGEYTYMGHTSPDGNILISKIHNHTHVVVHTQILNESYSNDDHIAPANVRLSNGNILVGYSSHSDNNTWHYRIGPDIDDLGSQSSLTASGLVAYSQIFTRGSSVYAVMRVGALESGTTWAMFVSSDNGATWGSQITFFQRDRGYILGRKTSSDVIRFWAILHAGESNNSIRVFDLDLSTGDFTSGGATVGNLDGTDLPIGMGDIAQLYAAPANSNIRLLDASDDGTAFAYAETDSGGDTTYKVAYLTGSDPHDAGDWTHKTVTAAGEFFYATSLYSGGVVFDRTVPANTAVYLSREDSGTWYIERWTTSDGGDNWSSSEVESGSSVHIRPVSPLGASADLPVLWQRGSYTDFTSNDLAIRFR